MKVIARVEGLSELATALAALPKATARNVLRRALMKRGQPMADTMRALVPDDPTSPESVDLKGSIGVGIKLSKRQARLHRKENKDDRQFADVFVGAGPKPHAHLQEFGTFFHGPQPYVRPAWDQHQNEILDGLKDDLWAEIDKAAKRHARKLARQAAKG
jgi:HK97 gp10 family phage protein